MDFFAPTEEPNDDSLPVGLLLNAPETILAREVVIGAGNRFEKLLYFGRDKNGPVAFPQLTVVIILVCLVIRPSVSDSGERRQGYGACDRCFPKK